MNKQVAEGPLGGFDGTGINALGKRMGKAGRLRGAKRPERRGRGVSTYGGGVTGRVIAAGIKRNFRKRRVGKTEKTSRDQVEGKSRPPIVLY